MFGNFFSNKARSNSKYQNKGFGKGMKTRKTVWVATPDSIRSVSFTSDASHSDRPVRMPK